MRMEGGTRLALRSFYGVQNRGGGGSRRRAHVEERVAPLVARAGVSAGGRRGRGVGRADLCSTDQVEAAGTARALARPARVVGRLQAAALAVLHTSRHSAGSCPKLAARGRQRFVDLYVSNAVQAVPPTPIVVTAEPEMVEDARRRRPRGFGLDAFAEAYYGRLREAAGAPGSPSVAPSCPCRSRPRRRRRARPPVAPEVISDVYGGAREAALNADRLGHEVRLRTRRPLPNPRPHAQVGCSARAPRQRHDGQRDELAQADEAISAASGWLARGSAHACARVVHGARRLEAPAEAVAFLEPRFSPKNREAALVVDRADADRRHFAAGPVLPQPPVDARATPP